MKRGDRVLVTGARGALGHHVMDVLASSGAQVFGTLRDGTHPPATGASAATWISCDVTKREEVRAAVEQSRPAFVIHAAGIAGTSDLGSLVATNVLALAHLLEALAGTAVERILVVGSSAEYAPARAREQIAEDHPLQPSNHYGLSKLFQFDLSRLALERGVPVLYARPFNMIGPGASPITAIGDITHRLADVIRSPDADALECGNLQRWRDYVDVRDAASACATLLAAGHVGGVYNICTGVPVLMADAVKRLLAMAGRRIGLRHADHPESVSYQVGDPSRIRGLGWAPARDLETSLRDGLEFELRALEHSR